MEQQKTLRQIMQEEADALGIACKIATAIHRRAGRQWSSLSPIQPDSASPAARIRVAFEAAASTAGGHVFSASAFVGNATADLPDACCLAVAPDALFKGTTGQHTLGLGGGPDATDADVFEFGDAFAAALALAGFDAMFKADKGCLEVTI